MKILQLELKGFKRITLSNISYIKLTCTEKIQLLLGSNGSGKSSLLRELTPLPAVQNDYEKDGFKRIKIENNNKIYTLTSRFNPKQEHSFIIDNKELNTSSTTATQRELVYEHFQITPEIRDLLLSSESLSFFSPAQRRYWFTLMSNTNYDYAISVFNRAKERLRDSNGAIKILRTRLINERNTSPDKTIVSTLTKEINSLKQIIETIYPLRNKNIYTNTELNTKVKLLEEQLKTISENLKNGIKEFNKKGINNTHDELRETLKELTTIIDEQTGKLNLLYEEHRGIKKTVSELETSNKYSLSDIETEIKNLTESLNSIRGNYIALKDDDSAESILKTVENALTILTPILYELPVTEKGSVTKERVNDLYNKVNSDENRIRFLQNQIEKLSNKIKEQEEIRDHNKATCPNCNHSWSIGYDALLLETYKVELENTNTQLFILKEINTKEKELLIKLNDILNNHRIIREFFSMNNSISFIVDEIIDKGYVNNSPRKIIMLFEKYRIDLISAVPVKNLLRDLKDLDNKKEIAKVSDVVALEQTSKRLTDVETNISKVNASLYILRNQKTDLIGTLSLIDKIESLSNQLTSNISARTVLLDTGIEVLRKETIDKIFFEVQRQLSEKEKTLLGFNNKDKIIEDIEKQIEILELDQISFKEIVDILSPTSGLIAKGLTGFIKQFILNMNNILEKIWSYKLEILPCDIDEENGTDLDYKFKVLVGDNVIEDVSKGSSAMKEVIDLAFKLVSMKYLGLESHPVYLDEFAKTLDYEHRKTAHNTIVDLITNANFSQLFIINHYNDLYAGLTNSEVLVLHSANIVLPPGVVNKHVEIK